VLVFQTEEVPDKSPEIIAIIFLRKKTIRDYYNTDKNPTQSATLKQ